MHTSRPRRFRILDDKLAEIAATGADTLVTANPGCMMQLQTGLARARILTEVRHVIEVLDESYR
jgi:glycolate oxidase iron-sulfur subunit